MGNKLPGHQEKKSFWWRDILKLFDTFRGMAQAHAVNGKTILFGKTFGMGLYQPSFSRAILIHKKKENILLCIANELNHPLSCPYQNNILEHLQLNNEDLDTWTYMGPRIFFIIESI